MSKPHWDLLLIHATLATFTDGAPCGLLSDAEVFGNLGADRAAMFLEGIEMVLAIWAGEAPYNLEGKYWKISTERTLMAEIGQGFIAKPLQRPHPPIVVTAVSPHSSSVSQAGSRGWDVISANFLLPQWVKTHWPKYQEGCVAAGRIADPADWRVAKSLCVADDLTTARRYATEPDSPYRQYYHSLFTKLKKNGRLILFKTHPEQPDGEITLDVVCEKLIIWGTPDKVADDILAFREQVGDFGTLLRRQGLGGSHARPSLRDPDGGAGAAAGQCRDRDACHSGLTRSGGGCSENPGRHAVRQRRADVPASRQIRRTDGFRGQDRLWRLCMSADD